MPLGNFPTYMADLARGATSRWGLFHPKIVWGHFPNTENGELQQTFFQELLRKGFKREIFQLIFEDQIAGLVEKMPEGQELHSRFYLDGRITSIIEPGRWGIDHWRGERTSDHTRLEEILNQSGIGTPEREKIRALFSSDEGKPHWISEA